MPSIPSHTRANLALGALFLAAFVLGSAELVIVGVLDAVARDLAVPISTAGTLVTAYAIGVAAGGPLGRDLAETLPASAFNAGIAVGAAVGGIGVAARGPSAAVAAGRVICAAALPGTWAARFLQAPGVPRGGV
jgi:DHA1 family inner membrane transport protein